MGKVRPRAVMWLIITGESHREWALARLLGLDAALCPFLFSKSFLFSFLPVNTHTHIAFFSLCNACLSSVTHEGRTGKDLEDLISLRQNPRERRRGQLTAVTRETFCLSAFSAVHWKSQSQMLLSPRIPKSPCSQKGESF